MGFKNSRVCRTCPKCGRDYFGGRSSRKCVGCRTLETHRRINTKQLAMLRCCGGTGFLGTDRSTGKSLVARGYAVEDGAGFSITAAGMARARFKADTVHHSEGTRLDPSLLQDLPRKTEQEALI